MAKEFFEQFENIEKYDYEKAVAEDIEQWLEDDEPHIIEDWQGEGSLADWLERHESQWANLSGNIDGSYWCDSWKAECALFGNEDELRDAVEWFGIEEPKPDSPERCDIVIREYYLYRLIREVAEEWEETIEDAEDYGEWAEIGRHLIIRNEGETMELQPADRIRGAVRWNGRLWNKIAVRKGGESLECKNKEEWAG